MSDRQPINGNDPSAVRAAVIGRCQATNVKVNGTVRRIKELQDCADPTVQAAELQGLSMGMMVGILENQVTIFAALAHLMAESDERHRARVEIVRPGAVGLARVRG